MGDTILGPAGEAGGEDHADPSTPGLRVELHPLHLPPDLTQRVRLLLANTLLHIPYSCRRMIAATAQCWQDSDGFSTLEEGRSKLLLTPVPLGLGRLRLPSVSRSGKSAALRIFFDELRTNF